MKKYLLPLLLSICLFPIISRGQTSINFDSDENWTQDEAVSSFKSYGNHSYSEAGIIVRGTTVLRNSTAEQDGFDGALGTYSIRIKNVADAKIEITIPNGGVSDFSVDVRRWDGLPIPNFTVLYSLNSGTSWNSLPNIDGSLLITSDWFTYRGTINSGNENIKIAITNTGTTERIMVDNFAWSPFSSTPTPTITASVNALSDFSYQVKKGPSEHQIFTVSGVSLTNDVVITPPANFEISNNGTNYGTAPINLLQNSGTIAATTIYIRLAANLEVANYNGNIEISSAGAAKRTISLKGMVTSPPDYSIPYSENFTSGLGDFTSFSETGTQKWNWASFDNGCMVMSGFEVESNANIDWLISPAFNFSDLSNLELTFNEAINYLTAYSDVQIIISTNFTDDVKTATWTELIVNGRSAGDNWNFVTVDPVNLNEYSGEASVTIAFKYTSTKTTSTSWQIGSFSITGDESISEEPSNHVHNFAAVDGKITETSIELAWEENDGSVVASGYLIVVSTNAVVNPVNGIDPKNETNLSNGSGNIKVAHGTTTYLFDNCTANTTYNFSIYPYNGVGEQIVYKTADAPIKQATTLAPLAAPIIAPEAGTYFDSVQVSISYENEGAAIYYTTDGQEATIESILYEGPFTLHKTTLVSVIAITNGNYSKMSTTHFKIEASPIVVATPVILPIDAVSKLAIEVSIECETENAQIYFTIDGTQPNKESTLYTESFSIEETTTIKAIAFIEGTASEIATKTYTIETEVIPIEVATIAELRNGSENTVIQYNGIATITFVSDYRGQKFIQDGSGAILIDDPEGFISTSFNKGDGITQLTGKLYNYFGFLEFIPTSNANKTQALTKIEPQIITFNEFKTNFKQYESELIKLENITFNESGMFSNGINYTISNGSETTVLRSHFFGADYIGTAIPRMNVNATGFAVWHFEEAKIAPRDINDFEAFSGLNSFESDTHIFSNASFIYIENAMKPGHSVSIYQTDGRKIKKFNPKSNIEQIELNKAGIYMVVISKNNRAFKSEKVIITY